MMGTEILTIAPKMAVIIENEMGTFSTEIIFRSGRISSVYIVGGLWGVVGHTFSKLVNFECVGVLECWCVDVLVCWCVGVLEC